MGETGLNPRASKNKLPPLHWLPGGARAPTSLVLNAREGGELHFEAQGFSPVDHYHNLYTNPKCAKEPPKTGWDGDKSHLSSSVA